MAVNVGNRRFKGDGKGRQGGRKKGTPNKSSEEMRELITKFINEKWEDFVASYDALEPEKRCKVTIDLMQFAVPKLASIEYKDKDKPKTLADELDEMSGENTRE